MIDQGATVKPTERTTKTPHATTGIFATLRALLPAKGTGAPSSGPSQGTSARSLAPSALHASISYASVVIGLVAAAALAGASPANAAETTSPWWGLTTGSRPTDLQTAVGNGTNEVQRVSVTGTKGQFLVGDEATYLPQLIEYLKGERTLASITAGTVLPFDATAAEVQAGLQRATPEHVVQVSGGPLAAGVGNLTNGSTEVTAVTTSAGAFAVGQAIYGEGIPSGTTITALEPAGPGTLTLSADATETAAGVRLGALAAATGNLSAATGTGTLTEKSTEVTALATTAGTFAVGQEISGTGIPAGTTIAALEPTGPGTLTLSAPVNENESGTGVELHAGSRVVTGFSISAGTGAFVVGQAIFGKGIPSGTTITAVGAGSLTLSQPAGEARTGVGLGVATIYTVTFPSQSVAPVLAEANGLDVSFFHAEELELEGGLGQVGVSVVQQGTNSEQKLVVEAQNLGDAVVGCSAVPAGQGRYTEAECITPAGSPAEGVFEKTPSTITDTLPEGLRAVAAEGIAGRERDEQRGLVSCAIGALGKEVTCTYGEKPVPECGQPKHPACTTTLRTFEQIEVLISVIIEHAPGPGEVNTATVSGGGASGVRSATHGIEVDGSERFGTETYSLAPEQLGGSMDTQAGSHPFQLTTVVNANTKYDSARQEAQGEAPGNPRPVALVKDNVAELPAGLVGNPTPLEQCTDAQFAARLSLPAATVNECPASSAVGVVLVHYSLVGAFGTIGEHAVRAPIFNMVPLHGEPARFGFEVEGIVPVFLNASVRTGGDYGVTVGSHSIIQASWLTSAKLAFWGVPGSPLHDGQRGWECLFAYGTCPTSTSSSPPPFLTMPTSCGAFRSTLLADSWSYEERPSEVAKPATYELEQNGHQLKIDGCNHLPSTPSIEVKPDVPDASTSTGLTVKVHLPQTAELNPEGLAESALRNTTVTLPAGVAVNPSGANGLEACSASPGDLPGGRLGSPGDQIGYQGSAEPELEPGLTLPSFTPELPESLAAKGAVESHELSESEATLQPGINFCANGSKIGTVKIMLPILPHALEGAVYLADQNANPFGSLFAMYAVAEDPVSGVLVKLAFNVTLDPSTGQLVATSENSPQGPLETAEFHFFGGERAPLATPSRCGSYTTQASFTPWSAEPGEAPRQSSSTFNITSGPNGGPCTYPGQALPFGPSLTGGATNVNAGAFSPFTVTMSRKDGEQNLQSLEVHLPPGLSGILTGVELCPEPRANLGECGPNSLIGETTVSVGVGGDPFSVTGGKFYLTGPYNGSGSCTVGQSGCAPFGITFEVPAKAGPFDLERNSANPAGEDPCDCVIVRGKIEINPSTSAITITSNPPGTPDAIPTSIEGIPLEIQHVNAITTRNAFQFNPTNCGKMEVTGTIHSSENGIEKIGIPFQVTNCRSLAFSPKFKVSVGAKTSKADGASLSTTVTEPAGSLGTQANLAKVKVELPKQLPSRLTTLQKACTSKQFELNPANCPSESKIGYAKVITPLVPVPLEGPAIFVSHGGEAFPSLTMVLQGYGVTIDLVGTTFISKSGVTSTTFETVPDQPFSSFTLTLPTGKYSALTALGNVCTEKLAMPTEFIAQNGAEIHQTTPISVTGCKKTLTRAQKLKAALATCRKKAKKNKSKRDACERVAHKRYGPVKTAKKTRKK
jgi:hypothetical protein